MVLQAIHWVFCATKVGCSFSGAAELARIAVFHRAAALLAMVFSAWSRMLANVTSSFLIHSHTAGFDV